MNRLVARLIPLALLACSDASNPDDHEHGENEVITTVTLTFTPVDGGDDRTFTWTDPDNAGTPTIDPITLQDAHDYTFTVAFLNGLEDPPEDITSEVADEAEEHQVFYTGEGVAGPAAGDDPAAIVTHAYADADANGLPVGLVNDLVTNAPGAGTLIVTLRHMPEEGGAAVKVEGAAELVAEQGFGAIGGDDDANVTFELTVE